MLRENAFDTKIAPILNGIHPALVERSVASVELKRARNALAAAIAGKWGTPEASVEEVILKAKTLSSNVDEYGGIGGGFMDVDGAAVIEIQEVVQEQQLPLNADSNKRQRISRPPQHYGDYTNPINRGREAQYIDRRLGYDDNDAGAMHMAGAEDERGAPAAGVNVNVTDVLDTPGDDPLLVEYLQNGKLSPESRDKLLDRQPGNDGARKLRRAPWSGHGVARQDRGICDEPVYSV
jgi:hypothetical protein